MKSQNIYSITIYDHWAKDQGENLNKYLRRISPKIYHEVSKSSKPIDYLVIVFPNFKLIKESKNIFMQKLEKNLEKIPVIKNNSEIFHGTEVEKYLKKWMSKNSKKNSRFRLNYVNDFNPKGGFIGYHLNSNRFKVKLNKIRYLI